MQENMNHVVFSTMLSQINAAPHHIKRKVDFSIFRRKMSDLVGTLKKHEHPKSTPNV